MEEIQLTIVMTAEGKVGVQGPIDNKILCYGLLETAKEVIAHYHVQQARLVKPATLAEVPKGPRN